MFKQKYIKNYIVSKQSKKPMPIELIDLETYICARSSKFEDLVKKMQGLQILKTLSKKMQGLQILKTLSKISARSSKFEDLVNQTNHVSQI